MIIHDAIKYKSLKELRVGVNKYMGVNWSTTTCSENTLVNTFVGTGIHLTSQHVPQHFTHYTTESGGQYTGIL